MKINDLPEWVETEFEFPVTRAVIIDRVGDFEIDAPDRADSETLAALLERGGDESYESSKDLLDAIRGSLSDEYIGRKFYDDRGNNPLNSERDPPSNANDESF